MTIKEHLKRIVFVAIVFLTVGVVGYGLGWIIITLVKDEKAAKLYSTEMWVDKIYKGKSFYRYVLDRHIGYHTVYSKDSLWASPNEKIILVPEHKMNEIKDSLTYYKKLVHEQKCPDRE